MNVSDLIAPAQVVLGLRAADKKGVIERLAQLAAGRLGLDAAPIAQALIAREELGSTGMGEGVAIPHARLHDVYEPFGLFARLKGTVDFDAIDARPVDLVCLVLVPKAPADGEPLNALACVARRLREKNVLDHLRKARTPDALYSVLVQHPAGLG
jgi:PTS system nitrogen regulatory IIA component